jgi:hypothetical protein
MDDPAQPDPDIGPDQNIDSDGGDDDDYPKGPVI